MPVHDYFSEAELAAVREATRQAEARTAGELVCVIVERSDSYDDARWRAATLGALVGGLVAAYGLYISETWSTQTFLWPALAPLLGAAAAWLLAVSSPAIERELVGSETMQRRVHNRAAAAFVSEEVFETRGRTGVLIFLSLFEHRVEILCDEGIRRHVPAESWREITMKLAEGIGQGNAGPSLVAAVEACGELLATEGVERADDDRDELANEPRVLDD